MHPPATITEEHEALLEFMYMAPVGLVQTALDGEIEMINPVSAQLLMPLTGDGNLANLFTVLEGVVPDLRHRVASFTGSSGMVSDDLRIHLSAEKRGKSDPEMLTLSLLKLDETRLMAVVNDITQQVRRERLLKKNEAWFNAIFTGITDYALVSLDGRGHIDDWNESVGRVTGFTREALLDQPFSLFYPDGAITPDRLKDRLREADDDGWSLDQGWRLKADGSRFWASTMVVPLSEPAAPNTDCPASAVRDNLAYCLIVRDITDKREASEAYRKEISCDQLTGIANRRTFFEAAALEFERGKRSPRELALVMLDFDYFKFVNDTYGHPAGDAVLRHLADLLTATFRQVDVVARIGGDEFAVLLPSTDLDGAAAVARRLLNLVQSTSVETAGHQISYTLSGGVAAMDTGVANLDELMIQADRALYAAKAAGRNRIEVWSEELPHPTSGNPGETSKT